MSGLEISKSQEEAVEARVNAIATTEDQLAALRKNMEKSGFADMDVRLTNVDALRADATRGKYRGTCVLHVSEGENSFTMKLKNPPMIRHKGGYWILDRSNNAIGIAKDMPIKHWEPEPQKKR